MSIASSIRAGQVFVEISTNDTKLTKGLKRAQASLQQFGNNVRSIGMNLVAASAAVAAPLAISVKVFASFEQKMARVKALTGATGQDFERLAAEAKRLGETTVYSASQAADAMSFFALAGYDVEKIMKSIGPTLSMAAAGQMDVAQAADIATKIMAGMGMSADQLGYAVDVMTKAMTTANTDLAMLGDAMKFVGPIAKNAGISLEEIVAAIQLLSNAGIQGEMAGTTLRGMLLSLTSPSAEAAEQLRQMKVAVTDSAGAVRPLADILADLQKAMEGMGSGQKLNILGRIFDARQAAGAAELLSQGADKLREYTDALRDSGGTAAKIAAVQLDTLTGDATILKSALEGLGIAVGESLGSWLRSLTQWTTSVVTSFAQWVRENRQLVLLVAKVTASVGTLGGVLVGIGYSFIGMSTALKMVTTGLNAYKTAVVAAAAASKALWAVMAANPVTAVLAGIAALGIGIGIALSRVRELTSEMQKQRQAGDELRAADLERMRRLEQLSKKEKLNSAEMREARDAAAQFESRYGNIGVVLDETTGKLVIAAGAWEKLATAMNQVADAQLVKEYDEISTNIRDLSDRITNFMNFSGRMSEFSSLEEMTAQRDELFRRLEEIQNRRAKLSSGDQSALTEQSGPPVPGSGSSPLDTKDDSWIRKVHQLRLQMIKDEETRELALINEKYDHEVEEARAAGDEIENIEKARALEVEALKKRFAEQREEQERRGQYDLRMIKIQMIEDSYQRELAMIEARYDYEIEAAKRVGDLRQAQLLAEQRAAEIELAKAREALRIRDLNRSRAETIEELELRTKYKGAELERKLLELERQRALAAAEKSGEAVDLIKKEYDLRERLLNIGEDLALRSSAMGTFSSTALWGMSGEKTLVQEMKKQTQVLLTIRDKLGIDMVM